MAKQVLVVLPSPLDQKILSDYSKGRYEFHWLSDPSLQTVGGVITPCPNNPFNVEKFIKGAVEYVKLHSIDAVVYFGDLAGLLAAIICEQTGLPGPTVESQFLCIHKYYSRKVEPSKLWFEAVKLGSDDWKAVIKYPCYVKPLFMSHSQCQFVVRNEKGMETALATCLQELPAWFELYTSIFEKYIDIQKYPLAASRIVLAEELVPDGTEHTVEGWVDESGEPHIWLVSDEGYFTKPEKTVEGFFMPCQMPQKAIESMGEVSKQVAKNHGLKNTFFNVEVWYRHGGSRVDVTEINNRITLSYHDMYSQLFQTSPYYGALHLACGETDKVVDICPFKKSQSVLAVGGVFLMHAHVSGATKASEIIDYQAVRDHARWQKEGVLCSSGPGIDIGIPEESVIKKTGSAGVQMGAFTLFRPTFKEMLDKADKVRAMIFKKPELLPCEREEEYYNQILS